MYSIKSDSLTEYIDHFKKIQNIIYRDLYINDACFRILAINLLDYGPGWCVKKHRHSFFEACYITENNTYITINEKEYLLHPGQFYILPPGTFHSHRQDSEKGHIGFGLRWETNKYNTREGIYSNTFSGVENICEKLLHIQAYPVSDETTEVLECFKSLLKMSCSKASLLSLQMEAFQLISLLCSFYTLNLSKINAPSNQIYMKNKSVEAAVRFIEENYSQDIDAIEVAQFVHMSYIQLYRLFKSQLDETISGYINKVRLGNSQRLLVCSDMSIRNVAYESGFSSENHFCRAFKKSTGISPNEYRKVKGQLSQ